jgi:hypothetical protein
MSVENQSSARKPVEYRRGTPPPPIVAYEDVVAACGHPEKFGLFEDRKDRFRNDRRKKVTGRPCKACRERKRLAQEEAIQLRRAQQSDQAAGAKSAAAKRSRGAPRERLPDGARFEVVYDASRTQWRGTLTVGAAVFEGTAGGIFKLLGRLDKQYRNSLSGEGSK